MISRRRQSCCGSFCCSEEETITDEAAGWRPNKSRSLLPHLQPPPPLQPPLHSARLSELIKPKMNQLASRPACRAGICAWSLAGSARSMLDDTKINIHLSRLSNLTVFTKPSICTESSGNKHDYRGCGKREGGESQPTSRSSSILLQMFPAGAASQSRFNSQAKE